MNTEKILMCWNIPKINEELLYELYCIAGPIENISFSTSGKSCFIIYEHEEAVRTAKDIFQDTKLYGRVINMFDEKDIEEIYKQQEQLIENRKRHFEAEGEDTSYKRRPNFAQARSFNDRFLQGPHGAMNSSPSFNRNNAQSFPDYRVGRDNRLQNQFHSHNYENNHSHRSDTRHLSDSKTMNNDSDNIDTDPPPGISAEEFRVAYQNFSASGNPLNSPSKNSYQMRRDLQPSSNKKVEWSNSPNSKNAGENSVTNDYEDFLRQMSNPYTTPPPMNSYQQRHSSANLPQRFAQEELDESNRIGKADAKNKNHHIRVEDLRSTAINNPYDRPVSRNNFNTDADRNEQYDITDDRRNRLNKKESDMKGERRFQEKQDIRIPPRPQESYESFRNKSNRHHEHDRSRQPHQFEYNRSHNSDTKFRNFPSTGPSYLAQNSYHHQKDYSSRGYSPRNRRN